MTTDDQQDLFPDGQPMNPGIKRAYELADKKVRERTLKEGRPAEDEAAPATQQNMLAVKNFTDKRTRQTVDLMPIDAAPGEAPEFGAFVTHLMAPNFREDMAALITPIYSLSTKTDMQPWRWESHDKKQWVEVNPSRKGRATQHDGDIMTYATSVLMQEINNAVKEERPLPDRTIYLRSYDYLKWTGGDTSGDAYARFVDALDRLMGTQVKTNVMREDNVNVLDAFNILDRYRIFSYPAQDGGRTVKVVKLVLSEWMYLHIKRRQVLVVDPKYFELRRPIERRLYQVGLRHIGDKPSWTISEEKLYNRVGYNLDGNRASVRKFRSLMMDIIADNTIPGFVIELAKSATTGERQYKFSARSYNRPRQTKPVPLRRAK